MDNVELVLRFRSRGSVGFGSMGGMLWPEDYRNNMWTVSNRSSLHHSTFLDHTIHKRQGSTGKMAQAGWVLRLKRSGQMRKCMVKEQAKRRAEGGVLDWEMQGALPTSVLPSWWQTDWWFRGKHRSSLCLLTQGLRASEFSCCVYFCLLLANNCRGE